MNENIIGGLVSNAALLLALGLIYDIICCEKRSVGYILYQTIAGLFIGGMAIVIMATPVRWEAGIIFDTRTILLGLSGLIFGAIPTVIAMAIAAVYRINVGGGGTLTGVATIISSGFIGLVWRHYRFSRSQVITLMELYLFGIAIHLAMILCMLLLPLELIGKSIKSIAIPVIIIYPVATTLLGGLLVNRKRRYYIEEDLRKSTERFDLVTLHSRTITWEVDVTGLYTYINPVAESVIGYRPEELIGKLHCYDLHPMNEREKFKKAICDLFQKKSAFKDMINPIRTKNGTIIWVSTNGLPVLADDGTLKGFRGSNTDITERKQAQDLLERDETRLASLLLISQHDFATLKDLLDAALSECISLTESRIGYLYLYEESSQELTLNSLSKEVAKKCIIMEDKTICEAIRQRRPIIVNDFQAPNQFKKGYPEGHAPLHSFLTIPVFSRGAIVAVVGVANKVKEYTEADVRQLTLMMDAVWKMVEQARTSHALFFAETKFRSLLESIQLLAVMLDCHGNIIFCNDYLLDLTGWTRDETIGKNWFELFIPEKERESLRMVFNAKIASEKMKHYENTIVMHNGRERFIAWDNTVLNGPEGEVIGVASIGNDLTDHKRTEEQLRQSLKMESVGRLAGGVAHDFNNMLSVILGYSEMAKLSLAEGDPLLENMREISNAAERSRNITRQLLAFSRKEMISPIVVDLNVLVSQTCKTLTRLIGEDIHLVTSLAPDLWRIKNDPSQIDQILVNLTVNSRDAMPKGGILKIETLNSHLDEVYCCNFLEAQPGDYVQLSVSDSGIGMDPEILEYIFEPFYTTKEVGEGTGLGLATVYGIVTQNKGLIQVDSAPDHGSTFRIYLPRTTDETLSESDSELITCTGSGTILLVEDEESVRRMTAGTLECLGYDVLQAEAPQAALSICEQKNKEIDLLLTDVVMPGMNGMEMYERIRKIRPGLKALFMSGYATEGIAQRAVFEDGIHFIQKPFNMNQISIKITEAIGPFLGKASNTSDHSNWTIGQMKSEH